MEILGKILIISQSYNSGLIKYLKTSLDNQFDVLHEDSRIWEREKVDPRTLLHLCIIEAPELTGNVLQIIRHLNNKNETAILFITKMKEMNERKIEKAKAIEEGVDEYLPYPVALEEILASVKALIRWKMRMKENITILEFYELKLLPKSRRVFVADDREITLTKLEFDIVYYLATRSGQAVSYKEIYENVWGEEYVYTDDTNIMAHMHRIRRKLQDEKSLPLIENVYGYGYRFNRPGIRSVRYYENEKAI